jgi:DNA-binding NarL/FixJ family response regulator
MAGKPNRTITVAIAHHCVVLREGMARVVEQLGGYAVLLVAADGEELLAAFSAKQPAELVLLGLEMPGVDGYMAVAWLRERRPEVNCVALALNPTEQMVARALRVGALGVLPLTVGSEELGRALRQAHAGGYVRNALLKDQLDAKGRPPGLDRQSVEEIMALLSGQERKVLKLRCTRKHPRPCEVARTLKLDRRTVCTYERRICRKFGLRNSWELYLLLAKLGLVEG